VLFKVKVFEPEEVFRKHSINSYATPTACIEEGFVYVHFGTYGTACLETEKGEIIWKRDDLHCNHVQGPGSSPVLYKNLLILHLEGTDQRYIAALDKKTGKTVWKVDRPDEPYQRLKEIGRKAYITPLITQVDGRDLIISNGSAICIAYAADTGEEVWRIVKGAESTVAMPVESEGWIYFYTGLDLDQNGEEYSEIVAVDPSGTGNITGSNIRWSVKTPPMQLSTQVIKNGLLYTLDSKSVLNCLDALTGETIWTERLTGKYNSSLVWADGNVYFSSTRGETIVIREGRSYERISLNTLDGEIWATPAFLRASILLRTNKYLYKIRNEW
jgi:outer membrane protein assembly factor BamB